MIALISFLLLLSSTVPTSSLASSLCHKNEADALLDIKRSFRIPDSAFLSWDDSLDCCTWRGVSCNHDGRITALDLSSPYLSAIGGPISLSFTRLTALTTLSLSANITGTIPPLVVSSLTNLTSLTISHNDNLTGTIPRALCALPNLALLDLSYNNLIGNVPGCFGKNLVVLTLIKNRLSGPIPANIMRGVTHNPLFPSSPALILFNNRLSGPIPRSLGDVPLKSLQLSDNQLIGDASFLFKEKSSLEDIYLDGNELEFDLSKVEFPLRLTSINLSRNRIYGGIPRQISKLGRLGLLNLSYNKLCGPIPTAGVMKSFGASSFSNNKCLCGGPLKPCH